MDLVYLGGLIAFYGLCAWLVVGCDKLCADRPNSRADTSSSLDGSSHGDGRAAQ